MPLTCGRFHTKSRFSNTAQQSNTPVRWSWHEVPQVLVPQDCPKMGYPGHPHFPLTGPDPSPQVQ